jgi:GTPase SAR1 family protein
VLIGTNIIIFNYQSSFLILNILGESGVGKTSILDRFKDDTFSDSVPPTEGVNFGHQSVMAENTKIGLMLV